MTGGEPIAVIAALAAAYDRGWRAACGRDPGDPGEVPAAGDPAVSRVLYALRDLGITRGPTARRVLDLVGGAELTAAQTAAVLDAWPPESASTGGPAGPEPRWRSEPIPGPGAGGSV